MREPGSEEAVVAFMHILLGCLVGMSCFFSLHNFVFRCKNLQKRLLSTEGSPWRPSSFSEASIALRDGGNARICRLVSGNSLGTCDSYFFAGSYNISSFLGGISTGLDTHTYRCVYSILRSSSSCSSLFYPFGDLKFRGTRPLPHTHTKCRWKVRSGISWMMTSSIGHG